MRDHWMDGRVARRMGGWGGKAGEWTRWVGGWMGRPLDGRAGGPPDGWMGMEGVSGLDGWMNGETIGWTGGWPNGWVDGVGRRQVSGPDG